MEYTIGSSKNKMPEKCVKEATAGFKNPRLILFFSPVEGFGEYTRFLHERFPDSICMGATTMVAISKTSADRKGLKAMAFESGITCVADVLEDVDKYPIRYVERVKQCADKVKTSQNTVCLEFSTGLLCAEESVLSALNTILLDRKIPVIGGSAGDAGTASGTMVSLNGKVCERSTVFAIIHNEHGAAKIFRENIYEPLSGNVITATKVDVQTRTVYEYNHQPASRVYAKELGVDESRIEQYFNSNPVGRVLGNELYITANCAKAGSQGITYHSRIYENARMVVLKPSAYKEIIAETMEKIKSEIPRPSFSIMCNCLARTILFDTDGYLQEYAKTMGTVLGEYIGFSGYGEQIGEQNFNQTMTVVVFE